MGPWSGSRGPTNSHISALQVCTKLTGRDTLALAPSLSTYAPPVLSLTCWSCADLGVPPYRTEEEKKLWPLPGSRGRAGLCGTPVH